MTLRVMIAAGGTGGHFYPGLAVLDALRARTDVLPMFVGTPRGIEARVVPREGFALDLIRFFLCPIVALLVAVDRSAAVTEQGVRHARKSVGCQRSERLSRRRRSVTLPDRAGGSGAPK